MGWERLRIPQKPMPGLTTRTEFLSRAVNELTVVASAYFQR